MIYINKIKITLYSLLVFLLILGFVGCSSKYAYFQRSYEITDTFENYKILSDYNYFYTGSDIKPLAIIGLNQDFTLVDGKWKPLSLTSEKLKNLIETMMFQDGSEYKINPNGAAILTSDGIKIAIWYSAWEYSNVIMGEGNKVDIHKPTLIFNRTIKEKDD